MSWGIIKLCGCNCGECGEQVESGDEIVCAGGEVFHRECVEMGVAEVKDAD